MVRHNIMMVVMLASLYVWDCNAESKADKPRKDEARLQCEIFCEECLPDTVPLKRMGCLEKCIAKGVDIFTCPGEQTFLDEVTPISPILKMEIQQFWEERAEMFTAHDIDSFALTCTLDSILVVDKQIPVIGRDGRKTKLANFFESYPVLDSFDFVIDVCGEEYGTIWCNGAEVTYDKQGVIMAYYDFISLLTYVDGKLQEYTVVLFPETGKPAE